MPATTDYDPERHPELCPEHPAGEGHSMVARTLVRRFLTFHHKATPMFARACVVGLVCGLIAAAFHYVVLLMATFRWLAVMADLPPWLPPWLLSAVISALMVQASVWACRHFAPEAAGSGVHEVEGALVNVRPTRFGRVLPVKFMAGVLSLGSGLLLGREGPTIQMGGNAGLAIARLTKAPKRRENTLLAAGAGAGLAGAFNAPLAGILFVMEELRPYFPYSFIAFKCVVIASLLAVVTVRALMGDHMVVFDIGLMSDPPLAALALFAIFGALFGALGTLFNEMLLRVLDWRDSMPRLLRRYIGVPVGAGVGLLVLSLPELTGSGEEVIYDAMAGQFTPVVLLAVFGARFVLTVASYATGAPGGIFAPMLALGVTFGLAFGVACNALLPQLVPFPGVFALAGMGALFSATVGAPITGIVLVMEMTGNFAVVLPLIVTCVAATITAGGLGSTPIYTRLLTRVVNRSRRACAMARRESEPNGGDDKQTTGG